eukprot:COSAG02_NODE_6397_length_3599_cov_8.635143_3_plen_64_part_00
MTRRARGAADTIYDTDVRACGAHLNPYCVHRVPAGTAAMVLGALLVNRSYRCNYLYVIVRIFV